ncbi:hypothetical protein ETB97_002553 [Aspergillus alliaceus]|uniref:Secreted protein n=1 Tax=Petromyces alliaceus TaxID=209559 RepID=A0A8H6A173_PETAA|nr:hypothetical protein ETB97_002553 [Aspergillus burnettii]
MLHTTFKALISPLPSLALSLFPEPLPEPVPELGDEAAKASAVEQGDIADVPVTGDNGATEPVSQRAEEATGGLTTLHEPVLLEYAQPNTR